MELLEGTEEEIPIIEDPIIMEQEEDEEFD